MMKTILALAGVIILTAGLSACASPEEKAAEYVENARALFAEGKLNKADIEYRNALQINQNLPDAWFGLAQIHERKQEWRQVYGVLNRLRELAPAHVEARIMLGQLLLASNQLDQALTDAKEILEMAPDNASAHSLMAAVHFRLENFAGAMEEVNQALTLDPDNNEAILVQARVLIAQKKHVEALGVLDKAITKDPANVSMYLMKIQALGETGDKPAIEKVYLALIRQFPKNNTFKNALARQYLADKNVDGAEKLLEQIAQAESATVDERLRFVAFKNQYRSLEDAIAVTKSFIDANKAEYRYRFLLGELYAGNGQDEQAESIFQGIIDDDGLQANGLEARNKIVLLKLRADNKDKAIELVKEVLAQDKNNENALLYQAGFYINERKLDDAIVSLRTVLRDNPDSIKALGLLGQAYNASGSPELAIESYTKAFQLSPSTAPTANQLAASLVRQRNYAQADEVLQQSISSGNRSVDAFKLMVQVKLALGEWDEAEQLAKQLQTFEGQEAVSQQALGLVYQGKDQQDDSIEAFKRAHELSPESAQPIVALVRSYVREGKLDEAKDFLDSVISVDSNNVNAHLLLGQISVAGKKFPAAIKHFNKVIEINPAADVGYRSLAALYQRQNDSGNAEATIKRGLSANPASPALMISLASIYEVRAEFDKAISTYEDLLAKNPDVVVAKNNLASLLTDHRTDVASLEKARQIATELKSSQVPQFRDTYAWASVKVGTNLEEAVAILEGIVRENEQVDVYNYHLGEAYRRKGDSENALAYLNKAAELARPGSDIAVKAKQSLEQLK